MSISSITNDSTYQTILFENSHIRTKELYQEIYAYYCFKQPFLVVCNFLIAISFLGNIIRLFTADDPGYTTLIAIVLYVTFLFFYYFRMVRLNYNRECENSGNTPITYQITITEHAIIQRSSLGSTIEMHFSNIKKVIKTKNYILLITGARQMFILKQDAFTIGDKEEFCVFLHSKGYKLKCTPLQNKNP